MHLALLAAFIDVDALLHFFGKLLPPIVNQTNNMKEDVNVNKHAASSQQVLNVV